MATFGEIICLGEIFSGVKLTGIEASDCEDSVLACVDAKSNRILKVQDQKIIQSWSLRQGEKITSPAIFNQTLGEFITVVNNESLRLWTKDCVNFDKAKKKKTDHPVYRIINREHNEPLVLFIDGSISTLSNCKHTESSEYLSSGDSIVSSTFCKTSDSEFIVYITTDQNGRATVHVCMFCNQEQQWKHKSHSIDKNAGLICCCSSTINNDCFLYFLWNDGNLDQTSVTGETDFLSLNNIYIITPPVCENLSVVLLDPTHIAISGIKQNGKSGIGIIDTKFRAMQAFKEFPDNSTNQSPILNSDRYIYCTCKKHLYAFPYKCVTSSVADLIGHSAADDLKTSTPVFANHLQWNVQTQTVVADDSANEIHELFEKICDPGKCSSYTVFKKMATKLIQDLEKPMNANWIASYYMSKFINRCTKEEKFWPCTEIRELITKQFIPSSRILDIFEALIKHKEYTVIHTALGCLNNIPESAIVKCLQFYASSEDKEFNKLPKSPSRKSSLDENDESKSPFSPQKAYFINQIFSISFSDVFLLECLRSLDFKSVLVLLEHLYFLLNSEQKPYGSDTAPHRELTQNHILEWISLLLDAHVTQLIISPDSHKLLINLHETVETKLQVCDALVSLDAILSQLKEKCTITSQQKVGQYCIEVLHVL